MRFASLVSSLMLLLGSAALAAQGDALVVTGDVVNVRAGPSTDARVRLQVNRDEFAVELAREGEWVQVQLPDRNLTGWIHGSLLAAIPVAPVPEAETPPAAVAPQPAPGPAPEPASEPAPEPGPASAPPPQADRAAEPAPTTQPSPQDAESTTPQVAAAPRSQAEALDAFRASVTELNQRAVAVAGVDLFTDVRAAGEGVVQVTVTRTWSAVPEGGQQSYMNTLLAHWIDAAGRDGPRRVEVVGPDGQVLRQLAGP